MLMSIGLDPKSFSEDELDGELEGVTTIVSTAGALMCPVRSPNHLPSEKY